MSKQEKTVMVYPRNDWLGSFSSKLQSSLRKELERVPKNLCIDDDAAFRRTFAETCSASVTSTLPPDASSKPFHQAMYMLEEHSKALWQSPNQLDELVKKRTLEHPVTLGNGWQKHFDCLADLIETGHSITKRKIDDLASRDAKRAKAMSPAEVKREEMVGKALRLGTTKAVGMVDDPNRKPPAAVFKDLKRGVRKMTKHLPPVEEMDD